MVFVISILKLSFILFPSCLCISLPLWSSAWRDGLIFLFKGFLCKITSHSSKKLQNITPHLAYKQAKVFHTIL